jgi:hypothetical protein
MRGPPVTWILHECSEAQEALGTWVYSRGHFEALGPLGLNLSLRISIVSARVFQILGCPRTWRASSPLMVYISSFYDVFGAVSTRYGTGSTPGWPRPLFFEGWLHPLFLKNILWPWLWNFKPNMSQVRMIHTILFHPSSSIHQCHSNEFSRGSSPCRGCWLGPKRPRAMGPRERWSQHLGPW